jgi:cation diffusion facilitator family transporter
MIRLIIKRFINNDLNESDTRERLIGLTGVLGILCNTLIFSIKLGLGFMINSIAIISDAFNNLSDIGSSVVSIITAKLSNLPPDDEHPHGHGRYEYIGSLIVAFIIGTVGFELLKQSYDKIVHPSPVLFSIWVLVILAINILIKLWMYSYNMYIYKQINSKINKATAFDSLSDIIGTSLIMVAMVIGVYTTLPIDGVMGVIIACIIMYTGFDIAKETVSMLIGSVPDIEVQNQIQNIVNSGDYVIESHDLKIHDYGPGRVSASIHVEVPDFVNIVDAHSSIDRLEKDIKEKTNVDITIHIDPISTDKEKVDHINDQVQAELNLIDDTYYMRNFRIAETQFKLIVIFDLIISSDINEHEFNKIKHSVKEKLRQSYPDYDVIIDNVLNEEIK